jgi:hypothetical protein
MENEKCRSQLSVCFRRHFGSHLSVQTKPETVSSNLHHYVQKQVQLLSLMTMNKCVVFLQFLNKGSAAIFCYLFSSALLISLNVQFISALFSRATFYFTNPDDLPAKYSGLTIV